MVIGFGDLDIRELDFLGTCLLHWVYWLAWGSAGCTKVLEPGFLLFTYSETCKERTPLGPSHIAPTDTRITCHFVSPWLFQVYIETYKDNMPGLRSSVQAALSQFLSTFTERLREIEDKGVGQAVALSLLLM
jgi:hypothetical protein